MSPDDLRQLIAQRVRAGELPAPEAARPFLTIGSSGFCAGCGKWIASRELTYRVFLSGPKDFEMHSTCFETWSALET